MRRFVLPIVAGLMPLALMVQPAEAASYRAVFTSNAIIHSGPNGPHINQGWVGEEAIVDECDASGQWCHVIVPGPDGWVLKSVLRRKLNTDNAGCLGKKCTTAID